MVNTHFIGRLSISKILRLEKVFYISWFEDNLIDSKGRNLLDNIESFKSYSVQICLPITQDKSTLDLIENKEYINSKELVVYCVKPKYEKINDKGNYGSFRIYFGSIIKNNEKTQNIHRIPKKYVEIFDEIYDIEKLNNSIQEYNGMTIAEAITKDMDQVKKKINIGFDHVGLECILNKYYMKRDIKIDDIEYCKIYSDNLEIKEKTAFSNKYNFGGKRLYDLQSEMLKKLDMLTLDSFPREDRLDIETYEKYGLSYILLSDTHPWIYEGVKGIIAPYNGKANILDNGAINISYVKILPMIESIKREKFREIILSSIGWPYISN